MRDLALALGQQLATKILKGALQTLFEIIMHRRFDIGLYCATLVQATRAKLTEEFPHQRFDGPQ
ncbi:hypothetical protein D3C85_1690430 [compost metagenome]